jgi:DNA-binding beta-propeller fold protein YncE
VGQDADYAPEAALLVAAYAEGGLVYRFDTDRNRLEATLNTMGEGINAVAYDGINGALYVAYLNPTAPFTARGSVTVFAPDGTPTRGFGVGVVPSHIAFLRTTN